MKKKMLLGILLGVLLAAGNSFAYPSITISEDFHNSTSGGPFRITGDLGTFFSFCVETNEYLNIGGTYEVTSISGTVIGGGSGTNDNPPPGPNELSYAAAYLYLKWLGLDDKTDASTNNAYQAAIWYAEGEQDGSANNLYVEAYTNSKDWTDYHGVVVLNLGTNNQSLLGLAVPEPATMMLLGLGLVGLAAFGRKKLA